MKERQFFTRHNSLFRKRKRPADIREPSTEIKAAAEIIRGAQRLVVLTGAGMSAESGIATFRSKVDGLWQQFDASEVATPTAFKKNPLRVLEWHQLMRKICATAQPNAGHHAIAQMQDLFPETIVLTQNIDGLHQRAGSKFVLELHGNLFRMKGFCDPEAHGKNRSPIHCPACRGCTCPPVIWQPEHRAAIIEFTEIVEGEIASCPHCGGPLRPDIVWFDEGLDPHALDVAWRMADECDVMLVVGASLQVQPASGIPWRSAYKGAKVIEINPEPADATGFWTMRIPEKAAVALPQLVMALGAIT